MGGRPLGALVSQVVVATTSFGLALVALHQLGTSGLGSFSLLFAILITANALQTGWIGDSLTVLDRFDPGIRRALFRSQAVALVAIAVGTAVLGSFVAGVDATTALVFGVASAMWALEETMRRILIARRQFWSLVVNDAAFAAGAFGLLAASALGGAPSTLLTLVCTLLAGSVVAIGVAVIQLPRIELWRGPAAPARMAEVASFAGWRSLQVALRPGSLALVRAIVAAAVSIDAVGRLEAARLVIAPALTIVGGAGVYLLPTYAAQVRRRERFRPAVGTAMLAVGGVLAVYGLVAFALRDVLVDVFAGSGTAVATVAIAGWALFAVGFGAGVVPGSAAVAMGWSRRTFVVRAIDATTGVAAAAVLAVTGHVDAVPVGLALGTAVGAALLLRDVRRAAERPAVVGVSTTASKAAGNEASEGVSTELGEAVGDDVAHWRFVPMSTPNPTVIAPPPSPPPPPPPLPPSPRRPPRTGSAAVAVPPVPARPPARPSRRPLAVVQRELVWIVPLLLIVATEYKVRRRSIDDALAGRIDLMIAAELAVYALAGVWALWRLIPRRARLHPLMMVMWGYILTTAVSALYAEFPMLALARAVELVIIGAVVHLVATEGDLTTMRRFVHGWIVLISLSIAVGLAYVAPTTGPQEGRFTWLSVHSVTAGSMLAVSVPVLFGLWLAAGRRRQPWPRWVYGSLFAVHLVFLLMTRTRGSIGGAFVAVAVMAWLASGVRMKPELVLGSMVAGGALALAFGRPVLEFLTRGETVDQLGTFNRRTEIWSLAWQSFLDHPVFGLGFNSAKGVFFDETGLGGAHNSAINVMIDVGLVGLVWWTVLVVASLVLLVRLRGIERRATVPLPGAAGSARSDELILIGVFVALLVNSITTEGLGAGVNVMAIWLYLAATWLVVLDRDQQGVLQRAVDTSRHTTTRAHRRSLQTVG